MYIYKLVEYDDNGFPKDLIAVMYQKEAAIKLAEFMLTSGREVDIEEDEVSLDNELVAARMRYVPCNTTYASFFSESDFADLENLELEEIYEGEGERDEL